MLSLLVLIVLPSAYAADWYVDNQASGANSGNSWANAWEGFADINWGSVQPGDTVYISGGDKNDADGEKVYVDHISIGTSGTFDNPITLTVGTNSPYPSGHDGKVVIDHNLGGGFYGIGIRGYSNIIINGSSSDGNNILIRETNYAGIFIDGMIDNLKISNIDIDMQGNTMSSGIQAQLTRHAGDENAIEISYVNITNVAGNGGIWLFTISGRGNDFDSVIIHHTNINNFHGDGIKADYDGFTLYDSEIHDRGIRTTDHPDGVQGNGDWRYWKIYNNHFYNFFRADGDTQMNSYIRYGDAIGVDKEVREIYIYNNIFSEELPTPSCVFRGLEIATQAGIVDNVYICNNYIEKSPTISIMLDFDREGVYAASTVGVSNIFVENNIIVDSVGGDIEVDTGTSAGHVTYGDTNSGADVIIDYNIESSTEPMLDSEYRHVLGSPTIDNGVSLSSVFSTDKDGVHRPQGAGWDIGAYEYGGAHASSCTDQGYYCCPSDSTCSSTRSGTGCSGTCCASASQCTTGPVCGDGDCEGSENCNSCSTDCLLSGQVCCSGTAYTGNCCGDSDCSGSDTCENRVCTGPTPTCQNQDYECCDSCQSGPHPEYNSNCGSQVCCETCQGTTEIIVDNLDPEYSSVGDWWTSGYPGAYGSNSLGSDVNEGSVATWTPNLQAGQYQVYAWWTAGVGRVNDAKYTIYHASGSNIVTVNQKQNGGEWNLLGTYSLDAQSSVTLSDESTDPNYVPDEVSDSVCADAVRFLSIGGCTPMTLSELISEIDDWKAGEKDLNSVMQAIVEWKNGC